MLVAAGVIVTPFAIKAIVVALGFGAAGITAGSWAAGFMASYGGFVWAGSLCAILQSIGAVGLPFVLAVLASFFGGLFGAGVAGAFM